MGVDLKKLYAKVAEIKQKEKRNEFLKVNSNGAILGINGNKEKIGGAVKNLYASKKDVIDFTKLGSIDLSSYHVILVGSHDKKEPLADRLKKFVEDGGILITTSKCLESIIIDQFPGELAPEKEEIKGGAFKGEIASLDHPMIRGATKKKVLKFWVEDKSHPIKKVGLKIDEIAASKKLEKKHGAGTLIVAFPFGEGTIVHMLSRLHPREANESAHFLSAYMLSNILDEAVTKAIPDEIRRASDIGQMAYVNPVVLKDTDEKCVFCGSTFKEFEGKVFRCGGCGKDYHEFCLEQQLGRDGTCTECGRLLIYESFKQELFTTPQPQTPPPASQPPPPEEKKEEATPPPEEKKEESAPSPEEKKEEPTASEEKKEEPPPPPA
jgi:hypothetical protein